MLGETDGERDGLAEKLGDLLGRGDAERDAVMLGDREPGAVALSVPETESAAEMSLTRLITPVLWSTVMR